MNQVNEILRDIASFEKMRMDPTQEHVTVRNILKLQRRWKNR